MSATNQPNRPIEPTQDYSLWEKLYGRVLTDEEQLEIKLNLTSFFEVLIDEHKKQSKN